MKKLTTICAIVLASISAFAQSPQKMSYQAIVRNNANSLVINQAVGMQISILQGSASGSAVYIERHTPTSNANGLVSIEIGSGTIVSGNFSTIDWANGPYFIQTETDPTGGTNYTIIGVSQLLSVPYALHSKTAETVTTITETDPIFGASVASGLTGTDTAYWNNKLDSYTETDPIFGASIASGITSTDTAYWNDKLDSYTETDPIFGASIASGITATDTAYWNDKLDSYTETDPIFGASVASGITSTDTAYWNDKLDSYTETDPIFGASIASGITSTDTAYWNDKLDSYTETDPIFGASIASGITSTDTAYWNDKLDSYTETDPIFGASIASGITSTDTAYWNDKLDSYTETDPVFGASVASHISSADTVNWNNKLDSTSLLWQRIGNEIYYNSGRVGIGRIPFYPWGRLDVRDTVTSSNNSLVFIGPITDNISNEVRRGLLASITGTTGNLRAIQGNSIGFNSEKNIAISGFAENASYNIGALGQSYAVNTYTNGLNFAVRGEVGLSEYANIALSGACFGSTTTGENFGVYASANASTTANNYGIWAEAGNGGTNYAGFFNGDVTITGTLTNPSDIKLKSNIKELSNAMTIIRQLNPVEYDYKKEFSGKKLNLPESHQYGFIAQEIQTILPELVSSQKIKLGGALSNTKPTNADGVSETTGSTEAPEQFEFIGVNYISIIPILVQGIKEQDAKINELELLVIELMKQVEALKKQ